MFSTAFLETIVRDRRNGNLCDQVMLNEVAVARVSTIETTAELKVLSLQGDAPTRMGIATDTVRWSDHLGGQRLAAKIWERFGHIDGIVYPSRFDTRPCVMIYDRSVTKLNSPPGAPVPLLRHPEFARVLDDYQLALIVPP